MHKHEYADLLAEGWLPPEAALDLERRLVRLQAHVAEIDILLDDHILSMRQPHPDQARIDAESAALLRATQFVCPECGLTTVINRCPKCDWDGDYAAEETDG